MKKILLFLVLILSQTTLADTLYQANFGGYTGHFGPIEPGVATTPGIVYSGGAYGYGYSFGNANEAFTYPFSSQCCGCNPCTNCTSGYANRCR